MVPMHGAAAWGVFFVMGGVYLEGLENCKFRKGWLPFTGVSA